MRNSVSLSSLAAALSLTVGCHGVFHEAGGSSPDDPGDSPAPNPNGIPSGYAPGDVIPAPMAMRRLTNEEYDRTVEDLLGSDPGTSQRYRFRSDTVIAYG